MGGHPWMYIVPFEEDLQAALDKLKAREFAAGRYHPVVMDAPFPVRPDRPAPGAAHSSIEAARADAAEDGTRSILDMDRVVTTPHAPRPKPAGLEAMVQQGAGGKVIDMTALFGMINPPAFGTVSPVAPQVLMKLYGTSKPSRAAVESNTRFLSDVDRGTGVYIVLYEDDVPTEVCFAGYSFD